MKRLSLVLAALLCLARGAGADKPGPAPMPQGVLALCEATYPGYTIAVSDGWGTQTRGQFALLFTDGEDNILCIAEKAEADAAYAFTVENTHAVHEGEALPSLLIDTGGDALFYTYHEGASRSAHYHAVKEADGTWSDVDTIYIENTQEWGAGVQDGYLCYSYWLCDENENVLDTFSYAPVPVSAAFEARMPLERFDIEAFPLVPGALNGEALSEAAGALLPEGDSLVEIDVQQEALILLTEDAAGERRISICAWNEDAGAYAIDKTRTLPKGSWLDTIYNGEEEIIVCWRTERDVHHYSFQRCNDAERWTLRWGMTMKGNFGAGVNYLFNHDEGSGLAHNDGRYYGAHPWSDVTALDWTTLPHTFEEAFAQLDMRGYAVVNNPNPADRLHLRAAPDRNARSYGKFYNRTPVCVLDVMGDWAYVGVGGLEGYMMTKYLAFGEDMRGVQCAFPQLILREGYEKGTPIYTEPNENARRAGTAGGDDYLVGVYGDEWFIFMTDDGAVGYVRQALYWPGNG